MKSIRYMLLPALVLGIVSFCAPPAASAQETTGLSVEVGVICTGVEERAPVGADTTFAATVGQLCCFTKILGATDETTITHVWYWGDTERARVELPVRSASWRTYSQKTVMEHEVGAWRVEVLNAQGEILKTIRFRIAP